MKTDRELLYKQTIEQTGVMKKAISRRRMMQMMAAGAAVGAAPRFASADTRGPGWYTDDKMTGRVTMLVSAGQRWELPARGVLPIFNERFPNIEVDIQPGPHGEMVTKAMMLATSRSKDMDVLYTDYGQWPAFAAAEAMEPLEQFAGQDQGWLDDYLGDVPEAISKGYRVPAEPDGTLYGLTNDGNAKLHFYRRDLMEAAGIHKVPETWEEALETCKALHRPDQDQYGFITHRASRRLRGMGVLGHARLLRRRLVRQAGGRRLAPHLRQRHGIQGAGDLDQAHGVPPPGHPQRDRRRVQHRARQRHRGLRADSMGHRGAEQPRVQPVPGRDRHRSRASGGDGGERPPAPDGRSRPVRVRALGEQGGGRGSGSSTSTRGTTSTRASATPTWTAPASRRESRC